MLALLVGWAVLCVSAPGAAHSLRIVLHGARITPGDVTWLHVRGLAGGAVVEGRFGDRPLTFFPYAGGQAALVGIDLENRPGAVAWRIAATEPGRAPRTALGSFTVEARQFSVQHLTVPPAMADLDPDTERRATEEGARLRALYQTVTAERLWRGPFVRPIVGDEPGTGFGARRIINGKPRMPHAGIDFAAPRGTPVVAANAGRIALVGEFFFPGRLVVIDHGLGLYTLYFHLESILMTEGERVDRGQTIGTVGATGRATGPHLHFGAQVGPARVDPAALLRLSLAE